MQLNAILLFLRAGCAPEGLLHLPYPMQVTMSSLEIYCEKIRDLLDCSNSNLQVSRALGSLPMLQVATEVPISSQAEAMRVLQHGIANRAVASTAMNAGGHLPCCYE